MVRHMRYERELIVTPFLFDGTFVLHFVLILLLGMILFRTGGKGYKRSECQGHTNRFQ